MLKGDTLVLLFSQVKMMTTTSLKLSEELKHRVVAAAQNFGVTPHSFMVDAIRQAAVAAEKKAEFVEEAKAARKATLKTGVGYDTDEVHAYLRSRIAGADPAQPKAKPWRS